MSTPNLLWVAFVVIAIATWIVERTAWSWAGAFGRPILFTLACAALLCGIAIVYRSKRRLWPAGAVVLGLLVGQLWLVKSATAIWIWSTRGFAP